jgi:hypothetical protein
LSVMADVRLSRIASTLSLGVMGVAFSFTLLVAFGGVVNATVCFRT